MGRFTSRNVVHHRAHRTSHRPRGTVVSLGTVGFLMLATFAALADSPNPTSATATSVTNANGSITVTATGTWTWLNSRGCERPTGYAMDWNDPLQAGNVVGTLNGITYDVGVAVANGLNPVDNVIHPTETCTLSGGRANGTWGPISHTYAASTPFPRSGCVVTYDNKGGTAGGPGHQTDNSVEENNNAPGSDGCFTIPQPPVASVTTQSSPSSSSVVPGTAASDTATVTGTAGTPTGTVAFYLCSPSEVTASGCASGGTQVGSAVTLIAGSATSATTTNTTATGTYCWRAVYSGNATYATKSHTNASIGASGECFSVAKVPPTVATTSAPTGSGVAPGASVSDTATVTGSAGPATGTVSFWLCAPAQVTASGCASGGTQIGGAVTLVGGSATSASTTSALLTGKYCWRAEYSGDSIYLAATHTNAVSECFTVSTLAPSLASQSSPSSSSAVPGTAASDTVTVSGILGTPTGTVTFLLCGPTQISVAGCASGGTQVGSAVTLVNGSATSPSTTNTTAEGSYCWRAEYSGNAVYAAASHTNAAIGVNGECFGVRRITASVSTTASGTGSDQDPGVAVSDLAHLTGAAGTPTGTVTFFLCSPSQVTASGCATGGTQIGGAVTLNASGDATSASTSTTLATGTYCWRAEYSGDSVYVAGTHTNATSECFNVVDDPPSLLDPDIETTSDPAGSGHAPGVSVRDVATVSGPSAAVVPTGTMTFFLCAPSAVTNAGCTSGGTQIGSPMTLNASGAATSASTTNTLSVGKYCWRAVYSGDVNYNSGSHTNGTSECFRTDKAHPTITTIPRPSAADVGDTIFDTATVTGGVNPTGTVRFELFGPSDPDCNGNPVFIDTQTLVGGDATSDSYVPPTFGRYRWVATYSGDARNVSVTHGCQAEVVLVSEVLGELIPNLPVTGVSSRAMQLFGLLLLAMGAILFPTLLRSRRAEAIIDRRPPPR